MAFTWWFGVKFSPGGLGTFHAMVNSLVHTVMYFYYGISALGPEYRRYIWWKKYLTTFQMVSQTYPIKKLLGYYIRTQDRIKLTLKVLSQNALFTWKPLWIWRLRGQLYSNLGALKSPIQLFLMITLDAICGCRGTHVEYCHSISKLYISNCV